MASWSDPAAVVLLLMAGPAVIGRSRGRSNHVAANFGLVAGAAGIARPLGARFWLSAVPGSGPAAPLVARGYGAFVAGNAGVITFSIKDAPDFAARMWRRVRG